jgi:glycosyltransferase involved in cell wall biosynthesis
MRGRRRKAVSRLAPVALNPRTPARTRLQLARMFLSAGALDEAAEALIAGQATAGVDDLVLLARVRRSQGDFDAAVKTAQEAIAIAPRNRSARMILARSTSERDIYTPGWRPALPASAKRFQPVRGRVLHVVSHALPQWQGGHTIRTQSAAHAQLKAGLDPVVATGIDASAGGSRGPSVDSWSIDGVPYRSLGPDPGVDVAPATFRAKEVAIAARIAEELLPAVVHAVSPYRDAQIALALRDGYGLPFVYEVRGFREERFVSGSSRGGVNAARRSMVIACETEAMRLADAVVTLSDGMRDEIVSRGIPEARVWVVPNAVEIERFTPLPRDDALASRLGMGSDPVIGYISTFAAHENIPCLLEATAELRRRGHRAQCLLVGDGRHGERGELEALAERLGLLDGTVIFTGRVPFETVAAYYSLIDVFVVPRLNEPVSAVVTPLKPYEAMAMERAVVVSRIPALMEMIVEGETALAFAPGDARDLATTIEPLLTSPDRRRALGQAARAWVQANRAWAANAEIYRRLYASLGAA